MSGVRWLVAAVAAGVLAATFGAGSAAIAGGGCGPGDEYCLGPSAEITKGPKEKTTKRRATFKFKSEASRARFRCSVDGGPYNRCKSPRKLRRLKPGDHVFRVQAVSREGVGGVPARHRWTVIDRHSPPVNPPPDPS